MELNNQTNTTTTETSAVTVAEPTSLPDLPPAPNKNGIAKIVITAVLACAVVAAGIFSAKIFLKPDPEKVVKAAVVSTYSQQQKFENKIYSEIPAAKMMFGGEPRSDYENSFSLTLNSVGGFNYAEMISAFLSGTSVSGSSVVSQTEKLSAIDIALSHRDTDLISANVFLSPELAVVSSPELSPKRLSAVPSSLVEDYKNSIFYDPDVLPDAAMQAIQDSLTSAFEGNGLTASDIKKMESDINAIVAKAAANAQYSFDEQSKLYTVKLAGSDVKNAIIELSRYVYTDSNAAPFFRRSLEPALMTDKQYKGYDQAANDMLTQLEEQLPELPTVIELDIAKNVINSAKIVVTPAENSASDTSFSDIVTELKFSPSSSFAQVSMTVAENGSEATVFSTAQSSLENGVYSFSFVIDVFADDASMSIPFSFTLAKQGDLDYQLSVDVSSNDETFIAAFVADGTAVAENGVLRCEIPSFTADVTAYDQTYNAEFSINGSSGPISTMPSAPSEHIAFFKMTEDDVDNLFDDISDGSKAIVDKLSKIFLG